MLASGMGRHYLWCSLQDETTHIWIWYCNAVDITYTLCYKLLPWRCKIHLTFGS